MEFLKRIYHYLLSFFSACIYRFPSRKIFVFGVTGTKGKSTTVELLSFIFEYAGIKTAFLSSVRVKIGGRSEKNMTENTMPGRFFIQKFLAGAVRSGCKVAFVEVTSQGVRQYRHRFIDFNGAVILNLRPEHIEAHGSFENYRAAKLKFFEDAARFSRKVPKHFFINEEDPSADLFFDAAHAGGRVCAHERGVYVSDDARGESFACNSDLHYFGREHFIETRLAGGRRSIGDWLSNNFNLENAAAASAVALSYGISWETIQKALSLFPGIPGRMEVVQKTPFAAIVDYAHTPDSLEAAYTAVKTQYLTPRKGKGIKEKGKCICVLGAAGGGRDRWKRKELGSIAARFCDTVILTNEDPYDESPEAIIDEIASGLRGSGSNKNYMRVIDRREAIRKAIAIAMEGDVIITTGKGSESWIHLHGGKRTPWNERRVFEEELENSKR